MTSIKKKYGKLIVIVAPSGAGKSTLIERIKQDFPQIRESVSCTTRPMRTGEKNGINYFFISEEEFLVKKKNKEFIEWAKVHSNYYGTSKNFIEEKRQKGVSILLDLDVQGTEQIKKIYRDEVQAIFIEPPSVEELKKRLLSRGTDKKEVIEERIQNAMNELKKKDNFDFKVTNDDLSKAYQNLKGIIEKILSED